MARLVEALAVVCGVPTDAVAQTACSYLFVGEPRNPDSVGMAVRAYARGMFITGAPRLPWGADPLTSPKEAWEALAAAELIPFDAVDDPRRRFADPLVGEIRTTSTPAVLDDLATHLVHGCTLSGRRVSLRFELYHPLHAALLDGTLAPRLLLDRYARELRRAAAATPLPHPPTVAVCVMMAADWANVLALEAATRETMGYAGPILWLDPSAAAELPDETHMVALRVPPL